MSKSMKAQPYTGEGLPADLPATEAADEILLQAGKAVDRKCKIYKGTLSVDHLQDDPVWWILHQP